LLTALKLTQTLGFVCAALAMYGWVYHLWRQRAAAWLAAVAYTVAPFHLVNVYVRGDSLSEFCAFIWYPLILWALQRVAETRSLSRTWLLALTYAGLALTHNVSALIFSPFILLYLLFLAWRTPAQRWRALGLGLGGVLLGLALSAWFWLPALLEADYGQMGTLTLGYFHYSKHFRTTDLVQPGLFFDYSIAPTPGEPGPFAMGGPQALAALAGLLVLGGRRTKDERRKNRSLSVFGRSSFVCLGLLLSTAMITPLSRPLWDHLSLLEKTQFPWRFLSVQALFAAVVAGGLVLRLKGRWVWGVAGTIVALLVVSVLAPLKPERLLISPDDVTTTRLLEYELFTGNIGTTIRYEYLPRETSPRLFTSDALIEPDASPQAIPLAGDLNEAVQTQHRPAERVWRVRAGDEGATLAFPLLYWPGWRAWVDGQSTPVNAVPGSGYLSLTIPPGEHTVRLKLGPTPLRARAETLSLLTLFILLASTLWQAKNTRHATRSTQYISRFTFYILRFTPMLLTLLLGLLLLASRSSSVDDTANDLTMDFAVMPYLHHNPDGVDFSGQARLSSYTLSADQPAPGDVLTVTLAWDGGEQTLGDKHVTLRLVSPAEHLQDDWLNNAPYTLAEDSAPLAPTTIHRLHVPKNTPRGLYLLQLSLRGPGGDLPARTPSGAGRGPLYLRPVRVIQGASLSPDAPVLALAGPDMRLHAAESSATHSNALRLDLEWSTVRRLAANYGVSLRLLDPQGNARVSRDTQPGYGFAPTSLWRPGERIADRYVLPLPDDLPSGDGYRLAIVFYRFPSLAQVAQVTLGPFALPLESPLIFEPPRRLFELPPLSYPLDVDFANGDHIRLAGYDLTKDAPLVTCHSPLALTLWWVAQRQPQVDYTTFVHLFDPETETIVTQHDAMPHQGSYPTSGWLADEVVSDTVQLSLDNVPPGNYRLAVGLYDVATDTRLPAIGPDGVPLPHQRLVLPDEVTVPGE
ncbi:MAG: 6-pyruvoyl-tetrahydropterin synthase-related protein, partial [Anaerolineae bacterium]